MLQIQLKYNIKYEQKYSQSSTGKLVLRFCTIALLIVQILN